VSLYGSSRNAEGFLDFCTDVSALICGGTRSQKAEGYNTRKIGRSRGREIDASFFSTSRSYALALSRNLGSAFIGGQIVLALRLTFHRP